MDGFVEVLVEATGRTELVPADWVGDPILGRGIEKTTRQRVLDGELEVADVDDVPTEKATVKQIEAYAELAGISLGGANTKAEMVAVITAALAAAPLPPEAAVGVPNDDVQTVPDVPVPLDPDAVQVEGSPTTQSTDGTESSDETPAAGDKE